MRDLDKKDMKILSLLSNDARQPFSQIGEVVDLSGPAVSERVRRLKEAGVINRFTIDVDRSVLQGGTAVLIDLDVPISSLDEARNRIERSEAVEHIFVTAECEMRFYARVGDKNIHNWTINLFSGISINSYSVSLVDNLKWTPNVEGAEFAIDCAECGKDIDNRGETARIDNETHYFCCISCLTQFEDRYQRLVQNK